MKKILEELKATDRIAISGHVRPDGDCIGSCMGLFLYLKKALPGAEVEVYLEKPADIFSCIKGIEHVKTDCSADICYDVCIAVDTVSSRMGDAEKYFNTAKKTINIDHHISNASGCGMVNYVNPQASSASELVYELLEEELIDEPIAKAIYIGMVHDTGVFQYSNTTPHTLEVAAKLISYGFDFSGLIDETFYEKTYVQNQILGRALLESIVFMDGKCIFSAIDKKTMDFYKVVPKDLDGIVSQLRTTRGVECAIFMYQTGQQEYKVSLRSNGRVDVAKVASYFGGGGHVRAAGCTMQGTYHDCINNLSLQIERQLEA
ncbi:MAG: bifunctional oligoribonuclease/PAP phosphatase NrnA [Lachnospiraceae bacterium]|nr:bifunctional oligoribonuclease/PAP phosphatase NrnA [Lachnospiraceae bacterium]